MRITTTRGGILFLALVLALTFLQQAVFGQVTGVDRLTATPVVTAAPVCDRSAWINMIWKNGDTVRPDGNYPDPVIANSDPTKSVHVCSVLITTTQQLRVPSIISFSTAVHTGFGPACAYSLRPTQFLGSIFTWPGMPITVSGQHVFTGLPGADLCITIQVPNSPYIDGTLAGALISYALY